MKKCPYCKAQFTPNPRVGERQITCGKPVCKAALKSDNNRKWRQRNPDYHRDYHPEGFARYQRNPDDVVSFFSSPKSFTINGPLEADFS